MDKNQAIIDFMITCPEVQNNPLFFNFIHGKEDNKQIITLANEKILNRTYINGDILKQYTFTLIDFKSVTYNAIVKEPGYPDDNVDDMASVQDIIDWVATQNELRNYPNFGNDCMIEEMRVLTDNPNLNGVDTNTSPPLAKYSMSIQIDYIDKSKRLWK